MKQEQIILLRGVMPSGKNSIPKMAVLCQHLEEAGFEHVRTYIQSGNILLRSDLSKQGLSQRIHDLIFEKYGADLAALVFFPEEIQAWIDALPFSPELDPSRVFFTMTMEETKAEREDLGRSRAAPHRAMCLHPCPRDLQELQANKQCPRASPRCDLHHPQPQHPSSHPRPRPR